MQKYVAADAQAVRTSWTGWVRAWTTKPPPSLARPYARVLQHGDTALGYVLSNPKINLDALTILTALPAHRRSRLQS